MMICKVLIMTDTCDFRSLKNKQSLDFEILLPAIIDLSKFQAKTSPLLCSFLFIHQ